MEKSKSQIKIGAFLGYVNIIIGNLIPFFYTPIMLKILGEDQHGLYKLANSAASYLSLAAFGIGTAVTRYLIKAKTEEGKEAEERMFGLFNILFGIVSAITLVAGTALALSLGLFYSNLGEENLARLKILVFIITLNTAVGFSSSSYNAAISSHERFLFIQIINLMLTCVSPIANLAMLYMGYASIGMTISTLIVNTIARFMCVIYVRKVLHLKPRYKNLPTEHIKEIFAFSAWIFVGTVVNQLYSATDTMIIGAIPELGTAAVSVYSVGTVFSHIVSSLAQTIQNLLTPKANKMVFSKASDEELSNFVIRSGRLQAILVSLVCSGFVAFGQPFVQLYAGEGYSEAYNVAVLIMIPGCIALVQSVALSIMTAKNQHKYRSLVYLFIAVVNVVGTYFAVQFLGITGAALVTGISYIIGPGFLLNRFYSKKMNLNVKRFWLNMLQIFFIPTIMSVCTLFIGKKFVDFYSWKNMFAGIGVYTVVFAASMWAFVLNEEEKALVTGILKLGKKRPLKNESISNVEENKRV